MSKAAGCERVLVMLKEQVINLLDDLIQICPDESDLMLVRLYFQVQTGTEELMQDFIKWVYPWKRQIYEKDETFFRDNDHLFGSLPVDKVRKFKQKLQDGTFDAQDKETIWRYFQVFIKLIEQYNKYK